MQGWHVYHACMGDLDVVGGLGGMDGMGEWHLLYVRGGLDGINFMDGMGSMDGLVAWMGWLAWMSCAL